MAAANPSAPSATAGSAKDCIYLDHHATTPVDPRVAAAMTPYFTQEFGNAASRTHAFGWRAEAAVELAREQVAAAVGATPEQVVFTSGATESNNLALQGGAAARERRGRHLITAATEHPSVLDPLHALADRGYALDVLPVDSEGRVEPEAVAGAIRDTTALVSVMAANNEIGALNPVAEIAAVCRAHGVLFHCDAAQAIGKVPFDCAALEVDLVSVSAHKCYGPKGVGALVVANRRARPRPLLFGGGHEAGLRPGTLPVPQIVGMGLALEIAVREREDEAKRQRVLRDRLWARLREAGAAAFANGGFDDRLPGTLNVGFHGVSADQLIAALPDLALSSGSACASAEPRPSHVLKALGLPDETIRSSFRIGLGRTTSESEVDRAASRILEEVAKLAPPAGDRGTQKGAVDSPRHP